MADVPMPVDLSEEAVADWLRAHGGATYYSLTRAVRALVEREVAKSRSALARPADAGDAKPVAWAIRHDCEDDPGDWAIYEDRAEAESSVTSAFFGPGYRVVPLYALPLPAAPATAVEEARKAFYEAARASILAERAYQAAVDNNPSFGGPWPECMETGKAATAAAALASNALDALLAAEADAKGGARG